jgi:hypothetical protein
MSMKPRNLLAAVCISVLAILAISTQTLAQSDGSEWATPVNLSGSGAASSPVIVVVPDGTLRILWWDEFDGLTVSDGTVFALWAPDATGSESDAEESWSAPTQAPVLVPTRVIRGGEEQVIPLPIGIMPYIVGDAGGRAHAFWLGNPDEETEDRALLSSRLAPGETIWIAPAELAVSASSLDATADVSGTLHLAYVQPIQTGGFPVGLYYQQSRNAGADWTEPAPIFLSRYLRQLLDGRTDLRLTAIDRNNVYAVWNDPQEGQLLVSHSDDSGLTWSEPQPFAASANQPWENQVIALPGGSAPLFWDRTREGQGVMAVSGSDDALTLAVWDGARWSETKHLDLRFRDPERGELLRLSDVQLALAPAPPGQEGDGETLIMVGIDQNDDLWITGIPMEGLERFFLRSSEDLIPFESGQEQQTSPPAPVNLSHSGAASNPVVVATLDDTLRSFWWDRFDGLMIADGSVLSSSVLSGTQEIATTEESWSEPRPVPLPVTTTPRILADAAGRVHAFWLEQPTGDQAAAAGGKPQARPLMYSRLASDAASWLPTVTLAESAATFHVAADATGALHLAYVQVADTPGSPAGVYYRRTEADGARWSASAALDQSRYIRLLSPETAYVRLAADDAGEIYATWDDPRLEQLTLAYSSDGGAVWETPKPIADSEGQARQGHLVAVPGREILLLWEDTGASAACSLYQAPAADLLSSATASGERILEELAQCPENAQFLPLDEGQVLMVAGTGSDALILAAWNGERWSEARRLSYSFTDSEMARQVYLGNLHATLVGLSESSAEGASDQALIAVGVDLEGDVWVTSSQMGMLELVFAPLPPWSAPMDFAQSEGVADRPAIASDSVGRLHVLWSDAPVPGEPGAALLYSRRDETSTASGSEVRWTSPAQVLPSADGRADQPALTVVGDQLHAVWRGGQEAQIFHSQSFVGDAYAASGWQEPQPLPGPVALASWPDIAADIGGTLHVVYAVPVNEGRGIYYTCSEDGESWSEARQIFDAAGAGWAMSDYPRLAVGLDGAIHVVWIRADPLGNDLTQEIYYARSVDEGETWSEPLEVVAGIYAWPEVAAGGVGTVQLLWNEATGERAWWYQWSTDGGAEWTRPERVPGFGNVPGPIGLVADGSGTAHLVGLGQDNGGVPDLIYLTWDGQKWGERETFRLDLALDEPVAGVSAAVLPALGQLDVVFRGQGAEGEAIQQTNIWHTERVVPVVAMTPMPTAAPQPTPTPLPTAVPMALPTQTPSLSQAQPPGSGDSVVDLLPLLLPGGLAALIVAGVFGLGLLRGMRRR